MNHTPAPYEVRQDSESETLIVLPDTDRRVGRAVARVFHADPDARQATAEFMVRACNNHAALVAMIQKISNGALTVETIADARKLLKAITK